MSFRYYGTQSGLQISPTLRAMLTETGEHVFRLAFGSDAETSRNFIFGVVVTQAAVAHEACGWEALEETGRCVHICYELCDAFPLHEDSEEYRQLQQSVERILSVNVRLLPFTQFQRSIAIYPALREIFRSGNFTGIFRNERDSLFDLKMHVVLSRWERAPFSSPSEPPASSVRGTEAGNKTQRDEWQTCFQSISRVFWYHAYVCEVIGEEVQDGLSKSNALRTYETVRAKGGADAAGKLALLDIVKLVYQYNYRVV